MRLSSWLARGSNRAAFFDSGALSKISGFGKRLRHLRVAAGLQQQDLAYWIEVPQSRISSWERKDVVPDPEICQALADLFGVGADVLGADFLSKT